MTQNKNNFNVYHQGCTDPVDPIMVFLQFPSSLTEEELMLQAKYAKLKKVRKKLSASKAAAKEGDASKGNKAGIMGAAPGQAKKGTGGSGSIGGGSMEAKVRGRSVVIMRRKKP